MKFLRGLLGRMALVLASVLCADWIAYALWPLFFHDPFAARSLDEIRRTVRQIPVTLPGPKSADEFTIGIFGGSVAGMLAGAWSKSGAHWAGSVELSKLMGRPLRVLDLTILSGNEPGQYNALHLFHDRIDAAVFVDGFNDRAIPPVNNEPACQFMRRFWEVNRKSLSELLEPMKQQHEQLRTLGESWLWVPFRYSAMFKYYLYTLSMESVPAMREHYRTLGAWTYDPVALGREAEGWGNCERLSTEYARSIDLPIYLFFQPNLHFDNTKPYSPQEQVLRHAGFSDNLTPFLAAAERQMMDLRMNGTPVWSLVDVFHEVGDTVYIDSCCHVNDEGSEIIANAIARIIVEHRPKAPHNVTEP